MVKLVVIYTFFMASGVAVEPEPFQPTEKGRPVRSMAVCREYAKESAKRMNEALAASHISPFTRVEARCERGKF